MTGVRKLRGLPSIFVAAILGAILAVGWLSAAAGSTARSALAGNCTVGTWQVRTAMPIDVYGAATSSNGTYAYAAGGYSFSQNDSVAKLYRYDPAANTWTTLAPPPVPIADASAQYSPLTNKIYVFGGVQGQFSTVELNTTYVYDIATNTWGSGANMPGTGDRMASGYYNGKIYLAGGFPSTAGNTPQSQVWIYDPSTNSFSTGASMPSGVAGPGFGVINGHLYVAGGRDNGNVALATLYDYDIAGNSWTQKASMPAAANVPGSAAVAQDGRLWVFGGGAPFGNFQATYDYNPATNTWGNGPNLNVGRSLIGSTAVGTTIVAAGGYDGSTTVNTTETLQLTCVGTITVTKHLISNPADPAKFNLRIDGTTYAANVGDGGTSGAVSVSAGTHTVSETAGTNANLGNYTARIACSDGSSGYGASLSGIQVNTGDNVTCTITNTRKLFKA